MTLPLLFIMLSHHYPMTFGAQRPWLVLALISATGVAVRQVFILRHKHKDTRATLALAAVLGVASVTYVTLEKGAAKGGAALSYAQVQPIFAKHCVACHAAHPTNAAFNAPPLGVLLDSADHAAAAAPRIQRVAVDSQVMPLGNMTGITPEERVALGRWIAGGAKP